MTYADGTEVRHGDWVVNPGPVAPDWGQAVVMRRRIWVKWQRRGEILSLVSADHLEHYATKAEAKAAYLRLFRSRS